jgi:hypothetical protein
VTAPSTTGRWSPQRVLDRHHVAERLAHAAGSHLATPEPERSRFAHGLADTARNRVGRLPVENSQEAKEMGWFWTDEQPGGMSLK